MRNFHNQAQEVLQTQSLTSVLCWSQLTPVLLKMCHGLEKGAWPPSYSNETSITKPDQKLQAQLSVKPVQKS